MTPPTTQTGMEKKIYNNINKRFCDIALEDLGIGEIGRMRLAREITNYFMKQLHSEITKAVEAERMRNKGIVLLCYREEIDREARIFNEALDLVYSRLTTLTKEEK